MIQFYGNEKVSSGQKHEHTVTVFGGRIQKRTSMPNEPSKVDQPFIKFIRNSIKEI